MENTFYPGHMKKSLDKMKDDLKAVDAVIELHDARIPLLSTPDRVINVLGQKPRLVVLNKSDLADESATKDWLSYFSENNIKAIALSSSDKALKKKIFSALSAVTEEKRKRDERRGIKKTTIKVMAVGIPNVGKSTFLNALMGRSSLKTGNKPGVTRGNQWVNSGKNLYVLDTAGILSPYYTSEEDFFKLAITGAVPIENVDSDRLLFFAISYLTENYAGLIKMRYEIDEGNAPDKIVYDFAKSRNIIKKEGEPDLNRATTLFINEIKSGRIGNITWEKREK